MKLLHFYIAIICCFTFSGSLYSQEADVTFGKNKIQYKNFKWNYIVSHHFKVYYYQGGNELAHNAARYAEEDLERITNLIGFDLDEGKKITLIIYNSKIDLQQSNIGIENGNMVGGQTNLIKTKVEIAFPGTQVNFKKEISAQISKLLINIMMYGGSLKDMVQNSYVFNLPDWFIIGASRYIGYGWDAKLENEMRQINVSNLRKPSHASTDDAELIGHSVWAFIVEKYGESSVSNILHITGIVNNVETAISSSLAVSYTNFTAEWQNYYNKEQQTLDAQFQKINTKGKKNSSINEVSINPSKTKIAYSKIINGRHKVFIYDIASKETSKVLAGGEITSIDKIHDHTPLLSWKNNSLLGIVHYKRGFLELVIKNISNDDQLIIPFKRFEQIISFDFSDDGKFIIFSAVVKGRTDLFEYEIERARMKPLTSNIFDEINVSYKPGTYDICFASNRINDTIEDPLGQYHEITDNFELYLYQHDSLTLKRLTYSKKSESRPLFIDKDNLIFFKSIDLQSYLFQLNLVNNSISQISTGEPSVFKYYPTDQGLAVIYNKDLYYCPKFEKPLIAKPINLKDDTIIISQKVYPTFNSINDIIIDSLVFETDVVRLEKKLAQERKDKNNAVWLSFPRGYEHLFGAEQVNSTLLIDQLRGTGVLLDVTMTEMMGDHYINTGVFGLTDLKSSNFFGEYRYLKRREDYYLRFDKGSIFAISSEAAHRYTSNTFDLNIAYPLNVSNRIVVSPFFTSTRYVDMNVLSVPDVVQNYVGYGIEYVFDNTKTHGMNMIEGTRAKFFWDNYLNVGDKERSFGKLKLDIRHYQKVHRDITLAGRLSSGIFVGKSKKNFLLGGVDNWLFSKTNFPPEGGGPLALELLTDNSDLLFLDYATGMRGFSYSQRFGNKYLLFNGEVRVPLVKYLHRSPVSSTFFRNLQLVGFYDFGASWSGSSPFSKNNSFNTQVIGGNGNPFVATVTNYRNPFLAAYGIGARSVLLGYYVKLDVAWGIENFTIKAPTAMLSLGYDF